MEPPVIDSASASGLADSLATRRWPWAVALAVSLLSVGLAARFSPSEPSKSAAPSGLTVDKGAVTIAPGASQWRFVKLGVAGEGATHWTDPVPARIAIDETRASKLGTPLSGRVGRVFVELGQRVAAGEPLFSVASAEIAELRANREKAAVDVKAARATLERVAALVESRALPAKDALSARQQLAQAELTLQLAQAKLTSLHVSASGESEFTVSSPRAGAVVEKNVLLGQQVSPDAAGVLMVVADVSSVWVVADLFEAQANDVHEGAGAEASCPSIPGLTLKGNVEMVSAVVDPARHTVPIRVRLANPDGALRPNVYARVRFSVPPRPATAVEISSSAIVSDGERQYVYVQERQGRFVRRDVLTGSAREGRILVLSGLRRGETVVEEGAILLDNQLALGG